MRRVVVIGLLMSLTPAGLAFAVSSSSPAYQQVSLTALASGARTAGVVGVSGGLVTLDTGSAYVDAALDSSPSARVRAAPEEPGALFRTVVGQVNGSAGRTVLTAPDAEASFPGQDTSASYAAAPPVRTGPVSLGTAAATAKVSDRTAYGFAQAASFELASVLGTGPSSSTVRMSADASSGKAASSATSEVSQVSVGVLSIESVVGTARVSADQDRHTAAQTLDVTGAVVAGQPVGITNAGVQAVGTPVLPATTLAQATARVNAALSSGGISVHTLGGRAVHDGRSAEASTGGVQISVASPDLPLGVAGNVLVVVLGGIDLTELDAPALPSVPTVVSSAPTTSATRPAPVVAVPPGITGPVQPSVAAASDGPAPQVAPAAAPTGFVVRGHRFSDKAALLAFACWQLVSLSTTTLYALVDRRRRIGASS